MNWIKPHSSNEANQIINYFYNNYKLHNLEVPHVWIITYGVETQPNEKKSEYVIEASDAHGGNDRKAGRCNGSNFTAFRKAACSFANPNTFGKFCSWDTGNKYAIICLESPKWNILLFIKNIWKILKN